MSERLLYVARGAMELSVALSLLNLSMSLALYVDWFQIFE